MSLVPHKIVALEGDTATAISTGKTTVASAVVVLYDSDNNAITLYDDAAFLNPAASKTTDSNGELVVFLTPGEYTQSVNGSVAKAVVIGGASPFTVNTFANLLLLSPEQTGQSFTCQERANAPYILGAEGTVAQAGDATFANNRVGVLQLTSDNDAAKFGIVSDGTDQTAKLTGAITRFIRILGRDRNYNLNLPVGKILVTNLQITGAGSEDNLTNGRFKLSGAGPINTDLVSSAATGDVIKISSGKVTLQNFSITGDGVTRSKTVGSGNGVNIDTTDGSTASSVTVASFRMENIQVTQQPDAGFKFFNPELVTTIDLVSSENGGDGYLYDGTNHAGDVKGISNLSLNCRALHNAGHGMRELKLSETTFINLQCLSNGATDQVYSTGRNTIFMNPDVESRLGIATSDTGIRLLGLGSKVISGLIVGFSQGIRLVGEGQEVNGTHFTNFGLPAPMVYAVNTDSATNYTVTLPKSSYTSSNVTKPTFPSLVHSGGTQKLGGLFATSTLIGKKNLFTISSNTPFNFGDNGASGTGNIGSLVYFVTLESNAVMQTPSSYEDGQEFEVIFLQDATGSRVVTFSGSPWVDTFSATGNAANTMSSVKFRCVTTAAGDKFIQIGAQMLWI